MIPQYEPVYGPEEREAVAKLMESGSWLTEGPKTREFEERIAAFLGVKHCFCVPSGTMGLVIALLAAGVEPGNHVNCPKLSMPATWNAIKLIGAIPHFGGNISISVHLNGIFSQLLGDLNIEDACQSFGSKWNNDYLGTFGDMGVFSFSPHKIISTGQGGCVVTNSDRFAARIRSLKDHDKINDFAGFGINAKFTDMQAVVGMSQLDKIEERIEFKRKLIKWYGFQENMFNPDTGQKDWVPWFAEYFDLRGVRQLADYLRKEGIQTRNYYEPLPNATSKDFEKSKNTLFLPSSFNLTEPVVKSIREKIIEFYTKRYTIGK